MNKGQAGIFIFLFFAGMAISHTTALAQKADHLYHLSISSEAGAIMDRQNAYYLIIDNYIHPVEIAFSKRALGQEVWKNKPYHPETGYAFFFANLRNKEILGNLYAGYAFIHIPVFHSGHFKSTIRAGAGIAYANDPYNPTENYKNVLIGSHVLATFNLETSVEYALTPDASINGSLSLNHFSNGQIKIPNYGVNLAGFKLGMSYSFGNLPTRREYANEDEPTTTSKKIHISFIPTIGTRQIEFYYGENFRTASFSIEASKEINFLETLEAGLSLFYDASNTADYERKFRERLDNSFNYTLGLYAGHEFNFYPVIIPVQMGYYAIHAKAEYRSSFFNRFGIRYYLFPGLFINVLHKSDFFFRGDNIEWGIGYKF